MSSASAGMVCLAYILGLLATAIPWGGWIVLASSICLALIVPRYWRIAPHAKVWLIAGVIGWSASLYLQVREPRPQANDISHFIPTRAGQTLVAVSGKVASIPHLTRSQKSQFWLEVQQLSQAVSQNGKREVNKQVSGKLYVTVPPLQATGLHPGQTIAVVGSPYLPKPAANPGGFDFKQYLAREGGFAGLRGCRVFDSQAYLAQGKAFANFNNCADPTLTDVQQKNQWGLWWIQQQIVRSQAQGLGTPEGALVSAMVLGSKAVDLPFDLKDQFTRVGLAAALAASGFQTSLILGVVLGLTRRSSVKIQFLAGTLSLVGFVGLTGLQPSIARAALMGFGSLLALLLERKVKPIGTLLVTAVLLLIWNPNWIWDLGFQLSFLATLGLLVTAPVLAEWLDWLPITVASLVTVPIAAYLWTLPVQLSAFGVLSPYSIPINIVTTLLITGISIGGMVSALAALVWFPAGSTLAWLLKYPTQGLIAIVTWFSQLPGNAYATGTISPLLMIALYGLIAIVWLHSWWRKRWWMALCLGVILTLVPLWHSKVAMARITLLATNREPVMVIQDRGQTALLNSGDTSAANFTVLPFLRKVGVNQIDWAIATQPTQNQTWKQIQAAVPVNSFWVTASENNQQVAMTSASSKYANNRTVLPTGQTVKLGGMQMTLLQAEPSVIQMQFRHQTWLWLGKLSAEQQFRLVKSAVLQPVQVLCWSGHALQPDLMAALQPKIAIASANKVHPKTADYFAQSKTHLYVTGQQGAVQWTTQQGFETTLEANETISSF